MKTLIFLTTTLISTTLLANTSQKNNSVQNSMKNYVNTLIDQNGFLPVVSDGKVLKLNLAKSQKYPDGFHAGVKAEGDLYASCADFTDKSGKKYDIDFLVSKTKSGFKVVQPIVHSIDGDKMKYDLDH